MKKISLMMMLGILSLSSYLSNAQSKDYPFEVNRSGSGNESIIFIPGFTCPAAVWNETLPYFQKKYTCYTVTMSGFAGTPARSDASFKHWEEGIAQFIKDKKIHPIVVGHSMGGGLAMALAADYPDIISKIVVVDAVPCLAAFRNPDFKSNPDNDCSGTIKQYTAMPDSQFLQMQRVGMRYLVADTSRIDQLVNWSATTDRVTFAKMYCDFTNTDLRNSIAHVKCPSLIMLEPSFERVSDMIDSQFSKLKQAKIVYATKGLHFIMYDDFDWYIDQMTTFINAK